MRRQLVAISLSIGRASGLEASAGGAAEDAPVEPTPGVRSSTGPASAPRTVDVTSLPAAPEPAGGAPTVVPIRYADPQAMKEAKSRGTGPMGDPTKQPDDRP